MEGELRDSGGSKAVVLKLFALATHFSNLQYTRDPPATGVFSNTFLRRKKRKRGKILNFEPEPSMLMYSLT